MSLSFPPALGTAMLPSGTSNGQTVAATGGGTGLGKGIAIEFAWLGANIAVLSRKPEHLATGTEAIISICGNALGIACGRTVPTLLLSLRARCRL
jgi:NAD(P)-dependent dehydrogenase (short-subunit alcohol dehydrogenase family)